MVKKSAKESAAKAPRPKKKKSMVRRGGRITLPTIKAIDSAYEKAKVDHPHLQSIGRARLVPPTKYQADIWYKGAINAQRRQDCQ